MAYQTNPQIQEWMEKSRFFNPLSGPIKGRLIGTEDYTCPECDGKIRIFITDIRGFKSGFIACSEGRCGHVNEKLREYFRNNDSSYSLQFVDAPESIFRSAKPSEK